MSDTKKYYWLKLQKDFFKRHDIRIVENMPNGKDYILFYLKLLVESISHYGELRFSDTIPYTDDMLATITNTNIDIVRSAVKLFTELNMIQILNDRTIFMLEVEKMVGSETAWAEKKRKHRLKEDNVPTLSDKSKSIEKEKDKELDKELELQNGSSSFSQTEFTDIVKLYSENIELPGPLTSDWLVSTLNDYGYEWFKNAIIIANQNGKRKQSYIKGILDNWKTNGGMKLDKDKKQTEHSNTVYSDDEMDEFEKKLLLKQNGGV